MTSTTFFIIFIPILAILLLAINLILAPHNPYQEKDSVFECGFHSFLGQNRTQFSISFFIFGLLFLLFDLEILLVYPYSVSSYTNDIYGLVIMMVFFVLLTLGFIFELGKNALTIDSRQTISNNDNRSVPYAHSLLYLKNAVFVKFVKSAITIIILLSLPFFLKTCFFHYLYTLMLFFLYSSFILYTFIYDNSINKSMSSYLYIIPVHINENICNVVNNSIINDNINGILLFLGLFMLILNIHYGTDKVFLLSLIKNIFNKKKLLSMFLVVFVINLAFYIVGFGSLDTTNLTTFILSLFCRLVLVKIIFAVIIYSINPREVISILSLNVVSVVVLMLISYINIFYIFPYYGPYILNIGIHYYNAIGNFFSKGDASFSLQQKIPIGIQKILSICPLFRKIINSLKEYYLNLPTDRSSFFRKVNTDIFTHNRNELKLVKLNKSLPVYSIKHLLNQTDHTILLNCKLSNVITYLTNNSAVLKSKLSNIIQNSAYLNSSLNLVCEDYKVTIRAQVEKGIVTELSINKDAIKTNGYQYDPNIDYALNELSFLKHSFSPPKDLVNYNIYSALSTGTPYLPNTGELYPGVVLNSVEPSEVVFDSEVQEQMSNSEGNSEGDSEVDVEMGYSEEKEKTEDPTIFPENTVRRILENDFYQTFISMNQDQLQSQLKELGEIFYSKFLQRTRKIPWILEGIEFKLKDWINGPHIVRVLTEDLKDIFRLKEIFVLTEGKFNYEMYNKLIYCIIEDFYINHADPDNIGENEDFELRSLINKWLCLCGRTWLYDIDNELPCSESRFFYFYHERHCCPFPQNTVRYLEYFPLYRRYLRSDITELEDELISIENLLYGKYIDRLRKINWINEAEFRLSDLVGHDDIYKVPMKILSIHLNREVPYQEEDYAFDYNKSNSVIYSIIEDFNINYADPENFNDSKDPDLRLLIKKWLCISGINWLSSDNLEYPDCFSGLIYHEHVFKEVHTNRGL